MTLSFAEQQQYLKEIGIDIWYPRLNLSHALLPQQFNECSNQLGKGMHEASTISMDSPVAGVSVGQQKEPEGVGSTITDESQIGFDAVEVPIRFAIRLYVVNDCLVVSSLASDYEIYENSASKLLKSILKITTSGEIILQHDHLISWPFFASPNASQGMSAAQKYVNGVIEHLIEAYHVKTLLAFGGVLAKLNSWKDLSGNFLTVPYVLLPSLYKMLQNPSLKKKAWQSIIQSDMLQK